MIRRCRTGREWPAVASPPVAGATLLELVVALFILSLVLGVTGLGLASLREPPEGEAARELASVRDSAIRLGAPVAVALPLPGARRGVTADTLQLLFLPDGRAVGPGVDPLTGVLHANK